MSDVKVSRISLSGGNLSYTLSGSEKDNVKEVILQCTDKVIHRISDVLNEDISLVARLEDGKTEVLKAEETVYESLLSTAFDPERNVHYIAKKGEDGRVLIGVWKTGSSRIVKGGYYLDKVDISGDTLTFYAFPKALPKAKDIEVLLWSKKFKETISAPVSAEDFNRGVFSLDIHDTKEKIAVEGVRWDIMVRFRNEENQLTFYRLEDKSNIHRLRRGNPFQFRFPKKENYRKEQSHRFLGEIPVERR